MSIDVVRNGALVSWGSHILKIGTERIFGVTKVSYGQKRTRTKGYGMNRAHTPMGRTNGKLEPETLKMTMHRHTWSGVQGSSDGLCLYLADQSEDGVSYGNASVPILLQVSEGSVISDIQWLECAVVSDAKSAEENPDPNMVEIEFDWMACIEDGLTLSDSTEEVI
jgi:hypothetical protein